MLRQKWVYIETRWADDPHTTKTASRYVSIWSEPYVWFRLHRSGQMGRRIFVPPGRQVITQMP